ncbi:hypothetical protein BANRA_00017 [Acinetobacter baumannii]|nr:hypothetical protein BANRA_00017 [Acinetobacter baumannii]
MLFFSLCWFYISSMSDAELSATRGQALMSMSYIAPTDSANLENYVTIAVILVL